MKKDRLLVFTKVGATIIKDPLIIEKLKGHPNTVLNPDLKNVAGISPHFWMLEKGVVLPIPPEERKQRIAEIGKHGGPSKIDTTPKPRTVDQLIPEAMSKLAAKVDFVEKKLGALQMALTLGDDAKVKRNRKIIFGVSAGIGLLLVYTLLKKGF